MLLATSPAAADMEAVEEISRLIAIAEAANRRMLESIITMSLGLVSERSDYPVAGDAERGRCLSSIASRTSGHKRVKEHQTTSLRSVVRDARVKKRKDEM
jgi:hypothetical protein